jgi:hypothetical protein
MSLIFGSLRMMSQYSQGFLMIESPFCGTGTPLKMSHKYARNGMPRPADAPPGWKDPLEFCQFCQLCQ